MKKFGDRKFSISVPGKWVLAGEHSVLKGMPAIALPHTQFKLHLGFEPAENPGLRTLPQEAQELALGLLEAACEMSGLKGASLPAGLLEIQSTIPFGAGLGSSAALCVALTHWISQTLDLTRDQVIEIATRLEDRFHGKSSGMDVAAVAMGCPIEFSITSSAKVIRPLELSAIPSFTFHDTGFRMKTSDCIARVEQMRIVQPKRGRLLDAQMGRASEKAKEGLKRYSESERHGGRSEALRIIRESMELGQDCFRQWDLLPESVVGIEARLREQGALAVKLTGAGGGGFLTALWPA